MRSFSLALSALALGVLVLAVLGLLLDPTVLCVLPVLALALPLALRRYPGERILARRTFQERRPRRAASQARPVPGFLICAPRGRLLLAFSLAVRPPPAAALLTAG